MIRMYETPLCPDCVEAKKILDDRKIPYEDIDITASIVHLKEFLALRDRESAFDAVKKEGKIGVPAFVREDGTVVFSLEAL